MQVHFLGTGGFHPNERRETSCVMLPEVGVVFDAGTGAYRIAERLQTPDLQVFLTHAHLDHICGLTYLLVPLLTSTIRTCRVYGQPEILKAVESHLFCPSIFPVRPRMDLVPLHDDIAIAGGIIRHWPLHHPGGSTGYRIDFASGQTLAYITDTMANTDSLPFLRGVDLLIHECTYPDALAGWCEQTGHSHTTLVAKLARDAGVKQLIVTHVDPQHTEDDPLVLEDARVLFPAASLAEDLLVVDLPLRGA